MDTVHEPVPIHPRGTCRFIGVPGKGNSMSIRGVAKELYRAMMQVEELQGKLRKRSLSVAEKAELAERLRQAQAERDRLQAMLEGAKDK